MDKKAVKSKVLGDLVKLMGSQSVKGLKKGEEMEVSVEKSAEKPDDMEPKPLHVSACGASVSELKGKLDKIFG